MKSAFFFERTTAPSWSSRCSRKTSTSSPSLGGSLNSSRATDPPARRKPLTLTAEPLSRKGNYAGNLFPEAEMRGVDVDGVVRPAERGHGPARVGLIPRREQGGLLRHRPRIRGTAPLGQATA